MKLKRRIVHEKYERHEINRYHPSGKLFHLVAKFPHTHFVLFVFFVDKLIF